MELNAEMIKKALECCTGDNDCNRCPYWVDVDVNCFDNVKSDALALINEQEQRIKELAEKNERLRQSLANSKSILANAKADTVRKMRESLKANSEIVYGDRAVCVDLIDQIAKEMLEGEK